MTSLKGEETKEIASFLNAIAIEKLQAEKNANPTKKVRL